MGRQRAHPPPANSWLKRFALPSEMSEKLPNAAFHIAVPDEEHGPTGAFQRPPIREISRAIAFDLVTPVLGIRNRPSKPFAFVPVPEAALNKDNDSVFSQNEVRLSWKRIVMQPVPEACGVKHLPHY